MSKQHVPTIFDCDLWLRQEQFVLELCVRALRILRATSDPTVVREDDINRNLHFCFRLANRQMADEGRGLDHIPVYECRNAPDATDVVRAPRESKRPDFQWQIVDHLAPARESVRDYTIECKRLGSPTKSGWILTEEYIVHGICRFADETYGYGKSSRSGAMIGYVQNMELGAILIQVNKHASVNCIEELTLSNDNWQPRNVSRLESVIRRTFPPSPFHLRHLWVDLRGEA